MHLVMVLCTHRGLVTSSLSRSEQEKPERQTPPLCEPAGTCHTCGRLFSPPEHYGRSPWLLKLPWITWSLYVFLRFHPDKVSPTHGTTLAERKGWLDITKIWPCKPRSLNFAKLMFETLHSCTQPQHLSRYSSSSSDAWYVAAFLAQTGPFSPTLHTYSGHENQAPILHPWGFHCSIGTWRLEKISLEPDPLLLQASTFTRLWA